MRPKTKLFDMDMKPPTTQKELAKRLAVSRQLISVHARKPQAPPISDVAAWKEFLAAVGRDGSAPPDLRRKLAEKRLAILEEQRKDAVRENMRKDGLLMLTADAERQAAEAMAMTFSELERIARESPPALAGLSAVEICKRLTASIERMRKELREKFQSIGKPKP